MLLWSAQEQLRTAARGSVPGSKRWKQNGYSSQSRGDAAGEAMRIALQHIGPQAVLKQRRRRGRRYVSRPRHINPIRQQLGLPLWNGLSALIHLFPSGTLSG